MPRAAEARWALRAGAAFVGAGLLASVLGPAAQFGFAAAAIGTVGLAHGASDAAVVPPPRRAAFVGAYLPVVAGVLIAWQRWPVAALAGFLLLSAAHFAVEDAPADAVAERLCRGLLPVAGPALLHRAGLAGLFDALTGNAPAAAVLAGAMAWLAAGALCALPVALAGARRRGGGRAAWLLAGGAAAAVLLPPFAGFAIAFVMLHAWPQLCERVAATGSVALPAYFRRHRMVLAGAAGVVALAAWLFADRALPAASALFAGLAALAVPHMLVTPLFEAGATSPRRGAMRAGGARRVTAVTRG